MKKPKAGNRKMTSRERYPKTQFPFSDELCDFMDQHSEFHESLKIANLKRFRFLPCILLSNTPASHKNSNDQVIGLFYYDWKKDIFKQDFIINVDVANKEFISYSANNNNPPYVRPLSEFFNKYGSGGKYYSRNDPNKPWVHHYSSVQALPDNRDLKKYAEKVQKESKLINDV